MILRRANVRRGLSLLEVIVALAVFLISYIAIWGLMNIAHDEAIELTYRNQATLLAQRKLAEIASGVEQFQSSGDAAFDDPDGDYSWSSDVASNDVSTLLSVVSVTVSRPYKGDTIKVTLTQMMLNPTNLGSTQDVQATPLSSQSSSSSSSGTTGTPSTTTPSPSGTGK
jgi:prepilin-type N-terminal cleavage/methylation domain-containing protein